MHLRGVLTRAEPGVEILKLPEGYRPAPRRLLLFAAACLNGCNDSPSRDSEGTDIAFVGGACDFPRP